MEYSVLKVIDGISKKIFEIFGQEYNIHTNGIPQKFDKPAFFIKLINGNEKHFRGIRYKNNKSLLRGTNRNYKVENKTLLFLVDYNTFVYKKAEEGEKMQKIDINGEVKENA